MAARDVQTASDVSGEHPVSSFSGVRSGADVGAPGGTAGGEGPEPERQSTVQVAPMSQTTMPTYVINLLRCPDRRAHMTRQLAKTGVSYEFVDAVDHKDLDLADTNLIDPRIFDNSWFRPGVAACALSHLRVYRKVLQDGPEIDAPDVALVLEDDITLPEDLLALAGAVAAQMSGAEVALLSFHSPEPSRFTIEGAIGLLAGRRLMHPVDLRQLTSGGAYLITRKACELMQSAVLPIRARADEWGHFQNSGAIDRVRCVVPLTVRKDYNFRSTMEYYPATSLHGKLQRAARRRVPVLYQVLAFRRRRIDARWSRIEIVEKT
ncbi:MAG TPA: glycosyltransferase family 25 protein [Acidimicrobiales bacterium]|nr:glycosyltransferase family 25 protein [Acidimicrobiales bacterium]